ARVHVASAPAPQSRPIGPIAAGKPQAVAVAAPMPMPLQLPPPAPIPSAAASDDGRAEVLRIVVFAWAVGVTLLSLWHACGWLWLLRMRRGTRIERLEPTMRRLIQRLRIRRAVALIETLRIDVPAVVGVLRPVILVPAGVLSG